LDLELVGERRRVQGDKEIKKEKEGKGNQGQVKEGQGKQRTRKERLDQAASSRGLVGNKFHV